jgi:hypothetical protein
MAVQIRCPECLAEVRVRRDGFVDSHPDGEGTCPFVRTARSGTKPVPRRLSPKEQAELNRKKSVLAAEESRRARKVIEQQTAIKKSEMCTVCGRNVGSNAKDGISGHTNRQTGDWCKGGSEASRRSSPNVWTVSGGLPGLGRR